MYSLCVSRPTLGACTYVQSDPLHKPGSPGSLLRTSRCVCKLIRAAPGEPNGERLAGASAPEGGGTGHTHRPAGGVASSPRPRLLARCQASPASPPSYKRRDRGAPASLRQQPAGRAGFRRVPVRLPAAASVTPVCGADGRRREPWELQPSRSRQVWGAWVGAGTTAPPLAPAQTPGAPRTRVSAAALGSVRLASARASAGRSGRPRRWRQREVAPSKFLPGTGEPGTAPPVGPGRLGGRWEQSGPGSGAGLVAPAACTGVDVLCTAACSATGENCAQTQVSALEGAWGRGLPAPAPASCGACGRLVGGHAAALRAGARRWCLACAHLGRRLETWRGHARCAGVA